MNIKETFCLLYFAFVLIMCSYCLPTPEKTKGCLFDSCYMFKDICQNGGYCVSKSCAEATCVCQKGFDGSHCQLSANKTMAGKPQPKNGNGNSRKRSGSPMSLFRALLNGDNGKRNGKKKETGKANIQGTEKPQISKETSGIITAKQNSSQVESSTTVASIGGSVIFKTNASVLYKNGMIATTTNKPDTTLVPDSTSVTASMHNRSQGTEQSETNKTLMTQVLENTTLPFTRISSIEKSNATADEASSKDANKHISISEQKKIQKTSTIKYAQTKTTMLPKMPAIPTSLSIGDVIHSPPVLTSAILRSTDQQQENRLQAEINNKTSSIKSTVTSQKLPTQSTKPVVDQVSTFKPKITHQSTTTVQSPVRTMESASKWKITNNKTRTFHEHIKALLHINTTTISNFTIHRPAAKYTSSDRVKKIKPLKSVSKPSVVIAKQVVNVPKPKLENLSLVVPSSGTTSRLVQAPPEIDINNNRWIVSSVDPLSFVDPRQQVISKLALILGKTTPKSKGIDKQEKKITKEHDKGEVAFNETRATVVDMKEIISTTESVLNVPTTTSDYDRSIVAYKTKEPEETMVSDNQLKDIKLAASVYEQFLPNPATKFTSMEKKFTASSEVHEPMNDIDSKLTLQASPKASVGKTTNTSFFPESVYRPVSLLGTDSGPLLGASSSKPIVGSTNISIDQLDTQTNEARVVNDSELVFNITLNITETDFVVSTLTSNITGNNDAKGSSENVQTKRTLSTPKNTNNITEDQAILGKGVDQLTQFGDPRGFRETPNVASLSILAPTMKEIAPKIRPSVQSFPLLEKATYMSTERNDPSETSAYFEIKKKSNEHDTKNKFIPEPKLPNISFAPKINHTTLLPIEQNMDNVLSRDETIKTSDETVYTTTESSIRATENGVISQHNMTDSQIINDINKSTIESIAATFSTLASNNIGPYTSWRKTTISAAASPTRFLSSKRSDGYGSNVTKPKFDPYLEHDKQMQLTGNEIVDDVSTLKPHFVTSTDISPATHSFNFEYVKDKIQNPSSKIDISSPKQAIGQLLTPSIANTLFLDDLTTPSPLFGKSTSVKKKHTF